MKIEEKNELLLAIVKLGPPPMTAKTETLHVLGSRDWGQYRLDWGISGPRGGPDEIAGLRGIRRPGGDYIPADEIRELLGGLIDFPIYTVHH